MSKLENHSLTHLVGFMFDFQGKGKVSACKVLYIWCIKATAIQQEGELRLYYAADEVQVH